MDKNKYSSDMKEEIDNILEGFHLNEYDLLEVRKKLLDLFSVSKRFEIDFDGNVLAGIEINNNEPKVFGAMNGWGNGISLEKCKITEKTD